MESYDELYEKAWDIIKQEFKGKVDKGGHPYEDHLFRVAWEAEQDTVFDDDLITDDVHLSGLLHDLVEDCDGWTVKRVEEEFNPEIAKAIECLTHKKNEPYTDYIERVKTNNIATIVKIADLQDNMDITRLKELTEKDFKRLQKYLKAHKQLTGK